MLRYTINKTLKILSYTGYILAIFLLQVSVTLETKAQTKTSEENIVKEVNSLSDALSTSYNNNPELKKARSSLELAQEQIIQQTSTWLPQVSFEFGLGLDYLILDQPNPKINTLTYPMRERLKVSQLIYDSGLTQTRIKAKKFEALAAEQTYYATEQDVLHRIAVLYNSIQSNRKKLAVSEKSLEQIKSQLDSALEESSFGKVSQTDLALLQASYASSQASLSQQSILLKQEELSFENLTGARLSDQILKPVDLSFLEIPKSEEEVIELALANRNQLNAQQYNLMAAKSYFGLAKFAVIPIIISVDFLAGWNQDLVNLDDLQINQNYNLALNVKIPLYSGGKEGSLRRQARINLETNQTNLSSIRKNTISAAKINFRTYKTTTNTILAARKALEANKRVEASYNSEFKLGLRSASDLLDGSKNLLESETILLDAINLNANAKINILKLTGAFLAKNLNLDIALYQPKERYNRIKSLFFYNE